MARPRELLTLASIADETGISYATLRNYALKHGEEIPSEGEGRSTRYPRAAVKVFQRLRKESKPGRKPKIAAVAEAPVPTPVSTPSLLAAVREKAPLEVVHPAAAGDGGLERELVSIRGYLERIAKSLERLASAPQGAAPVPPAPAPESRPEAASPAPVAPAAAPSASAAHASTEKVALPPIGREVRERQETAGHRRLHSLPKVMGQRGRRPE